MSVDYQTEGVVLDIRRFSLDDGPGVRTVVELKGCPLSCRWCARREAQKIRPCLLYKKEECVQCGRCRDACPGGVTAELEERAAEGFQCGGCGDCAAVCPTGALKLRGQRMTVQQVVRSIGKDAALMNGSGGGVTLAGGDPLTQYGFASEILKACREQSWHTAIVTTGYTYKETALRTVIPPADLVYLELKTLDEAVFRRYIGGSCRIIKENALRITEMAPTVIRIPVLPHINDSVEKIREMCEFIRTLPEVKLIQLVSCAWPETAGGGTPAPTKELQKLDAGTLSQLKNTAEQYGFACEIKG